MRDSRDSYDYVIVGGGSAGCVLAARLSESPDLRVLLLEAGPAATAPEVAIPAGFFKLFLTKWCWGYHTVEQPTLENRRVYWPRMKALGGCSAMNAMIYIRGHRLDYDTWRDEYGAIGWSFDDVLPYFLRSEDNSRGASAWHGVGGPMHVEDRVYTHRLSQLFIESAANWGLARNADFNGPVQEGVGSFQVSCRRGRRWSAADGYLHPAAVRPNLTVLPGAHVRRIVVKDGRANGVAYGRDGIETAVRANREVLIAAGTIGSPHLLMLSGIGPAAELAALGISVVVDRPAVGRGLQDHPVVPLVLGVRGVRSLDEYETPAQLARWRLLGRGPLASNVAEAGGFLGVEPGATAPDVQLHMAPVALWDNGLHEPPGPAMTIAPTLVDVRSRGRICLRSADPGWSPAIDPAYLQEAADLDRLVDALVASIEIAHNPPLAAVVTTPHLLDARDLRNRKALREHVRRWGQTLFHPVATCAMGGNDEAVVDSELRVRGVDGLRVVDASVLPAAPRGNTNAPTIMVAERAADLILGRGHAAQSGAAAVVDRAAPG